MLRESDFNANHFYKVALCSCPAFERLVGLVPRDARERSGLCWVMDGNVFGFDVV